MQLSKIGWGVAITVVVLLGVRIAIGLSNQPNDQELIEQALAESIEASKEGRPGGVMDKLSASLKVNEMDTSGNRGQIANYIKNNRPEVEVENKKALVTGDEARIVSPVTIRLNVLTQSFERQLSEVTMVFKKEDDRAYLVFPTKKWKLAEVRVPDSTAAEFMNWQG